MSQELIKCEGTSSHVRTIDDFDFELLDKTAHDRLGFDCGIAALNNFLQKTARQDMSKNKSTTFVLACRQLNNKGLKPIVGFFTIVEDQPLMVEIEEIDNKVRTFPHATLLGRLAVDKNYQGTGLGKELLITALDAITNSESPTLVLVDAKDGAIDFYKKYGFTAVSPKQPSTLYTVL